VSSPEEGTPSPPSPPRPRGRSRRARALILTIVIVALLVVAFVGFTGFYTDLLWFRSISASSVFARQIWTRVFLFLAFGIVIGGAVVANAVIAYRVRPAFRAMSVEQQALDRYRTALEPFRRIITVLLGLIVGLIAGASASSEWRTYMQWRYSTPFGTTDPQFHVDVSFFAFRLPFWRYLVGVGFTLVILSILVALVTHYLYGGLRLQTRGQRTTQAATVHLSVLLGLFMLVKAASYWLDRYELELKSSSLLTGLKYVDVHAVLPAKSILIAIAIICAILFFANVFRRTWALPGLAVGLLVLVAIVVGGIYPAFVQTFQVKPNEQTKEAPYIQNNINATRTAYGISNAKVTNYNPVLTPAAGALKANSQTIASTRVIDPAVVPPTFDQQQQIKNYYTFSDPLDMDRYTIGGKSVDTVVSVRDIDLTGIPAGQQNWINDHLVYTHGYGLVAANTNQAASDGSPNYIESAIPPTGSLQLTQPRIYFGENSPEYSIVGGTASSTPQELDYPDDNVPGGQQTTTYTGTGGVPVGSPFNRLLYSVKFKEPKILLSSQINSDSRILYIRDPRQRVQMVAPWLTIDGDPYPVSVGGKIEWVLDGYTTTNGYPYSERQSFGAATSNAVSAQSSTNVVAQSTGQDVNYIRNSVKAVVDAYNGTVTLYAWNPNGQSLDPVLQTWEKAFPNIVKPMSAIPAGLMPHLRYPEDLFQVQRTLLAKYHVTDSTIFYTGGEQWVIPQDPSSPTGGAVPPYYFTMQMPGQPSATYSLSTTYNPQGRPTLAAFMAVDSDPGPDYGTIRILQLPANTTVPGLTQVENLINTDPTISSELSLLRRGGSDTQYGNFIALPVGGGILYVVPIYLVSTGASGYPLLQKVATVFGNSKKFGFGNTLVQALNETFGGNSGTSGSGGTNNNSPPSSGTTLTLQQQVTRDLAAATAAETAAQNALKAGDFAEYGVQQEKLSAALASAAAAQAKVAAQSGSTPTSTASPSPSPTATAASSA
jgi:uncharacterized protein